MVCTFDFICRLKQIVPITVKFAYLHVILLDKLNSIQYTCQNI